MERTTVLCKTGQAAVGAYLGYPDLMGFGRHPMSIRMPGHNRKMAINKMSTVLDEMLIAGEGRFDN